MKDTTKTGRLATASLAALALLVTAPLSLASDPEKPGDKELAGEAKTETRAYVFDSTESYSFSDGDGETESFVISQNDGPTLRILTNKNGTEETKVFRQKDGEWVADGDYEMDDDMKALIEKAQDAKLKYEGGDFPENVFAWAHKDGDNPNIRVERIIKGDMPEGLRKLKTMRFNSDNVFFHSDSSIEGNLASAEMMLEQVEKQIAAAREKGEDRAKIRRAERKLEKARKELRAAQKELSED